MAKPKVVRPTGNKKSPAPKPADRFPFMVIKPYDNPATRPMYRDHKEAVSKMRAEVEQLYKQFEHLNTPDIRRHCTDIIAELGKLPRDGGSLDMPLGPIRYRVQLVKRQVAA